IRAIAETETDPAVIMTRINNLLSAHNPNLMFVTLIVGVIDLAEGRLECANAGHSAFCLLTPEGDLRLLEGRSGAPCGVQERLVYRRRATRLQAGAWLTGYTDGVSEAVGPGNSQDGEPRLYAALGPPAGRSAPDTLDALRDRVHEFVRD